MIARVRVGPMSEAPPVPKAFGAKLHWIVDHHHWFFGLVAVEQLFTQQYLGAGLAAVAWIADLYIASHWDDIAAFFRRLGLTTFYLVLGILGALALGIAVGGWLTTRLSTANASSGDTGRISWNFEQTAQAQSYFVNLNRLGTEEVRFTGFGWHGKNTSKDPISQFSGYVRSDITNEKLPFFIMAQDPNAPQTPFPLPHMILTRPEETYGIPGLADFDIVTFEGAVVETGKSGIPLSKFLKDFASFTVILEYDGTKVERHFTTEEIKKQISLFESQTGIQKQTVPLVTRKPNAAAPIGMPLFATPQTQPQHPPSQPSPNGK